MGGLQLRPYQVEAVTSWHSRCATGLRRGIINLPTGTGKTVLGLVIAKNTQGRVLWLAHRDELIEQPQRAATAVWPGIKAGVVKADRDELSAEVVFASVQTLARQNRLARLATAGGFSLVIVDEAHHATASSYMRILEGVGAFERGGPPVLGLTATVERGDGAGLNGAFQEVVYQLPLLHAMKAGYLVDLTMRQARLAVDLDAIRSTAGDWNEGELGEALLQAGVAQATAEAYVQHAAERKALIFCVTVEQAERTAHALQQLGVAAECLSGKTPAAERKALLGRLKSGETQVVVNCAVLTEGFDEPSLQAVVVARPTRSKTLYLQMIGRGTRTYPGKSDCVIVDLCGSSSRHTLMQAPIIFGLDPKKAHGKRVMEAVTARESRADLVHSVLSNSGEAPRAAFKWVKAEPWLFSLSLGKDRNRDRDNGSLLLIARPSGEWDVWQVRRDAAPSCISGGRPLELELAQGIAEDIVRRLDVGALVRQDAAWRRRPASEASLTALERWGMRRPEREISQGEAADLLTAEVARAHAKKLSRQKFPL